MTQEQLNRWAESQTVITLSRLSMLAVTPMMAVIAFFGIGWLDGRYVVRADYEKVIDQTAETKSRLAILENNQVRGRADREQFQDATTDALQELLRLSSATNERLARFEEQLKSQQLQIDRSR